MIDDNATIDKLRWIMAQLRDPLSGCPWDKKQTLESLIPYTLEEAYEVAEAIDRQDMPELAKELGDLLFQVIFYCQLAAEESQFNFDTVVAEICEKLIRRHPHVFSDQQFTSEQQIKANWEQEKAKERQDKSGDNNLSILADIPNRLPALAQALKIQKRCAHVGFDWPDPLQVVDKIAEEVEEVREHLPDGADSDAIGEEIGDLLFAVVNLSRHVKKDPDTLLRQANKKFIRRFQQLEQLASTQGHKLDDLKLDEMETLWQQVKLTE